MNNGLTIAFFGSSLVSSYWNGAATYYRGLVRALAARGHRVTFYEPDAYKRQQHRDIADPPWARVVVYPASVDAARACLDEARGSDVVIKASGVGVFDDLLEAGVLSCRSDGSLVVFWDVDAPATLERMAQPQDPLRPLIPRFDLVLTYGGGAEVMGAYAELGARHCAPIYNAVDPEIHHPAGRDQRYAADLSFLGNRLPDRETRVDHFFFAPAAALPARRFLIGGSGWDGKLMPGNVRCVGHVPTADHNALNRSAMAVLNINRDAMARFGHSPATRVFEAAGAGACLITDAFAGIERFLEPGREVLVARTGDDVVEHLRSLDRPRSAAIGAAAMERVLAEHTYVHRAAEAEALFTGFRARAATATGARS
jgi:spore maturation protein CgeB